MVKIRRSLIRVYLNPKNLESSIVFYEHLFGKQCDLRFKYPEAGLELAQIGPLLLLAGSDESLARFKITRATFLVDSLDEARAELLNLGAVILEEPKQVPTGMNMRVKHPEGTIVEYVEHASK